MTIPLNKLPSFYGFAKSVYSQGFKGWRLWQVKLEWENLVKNWKLILTVLLWRVFWLTKKSNIRSGNGNYRDLWLILRLCKESLLSRGFKGWRSWQWNQSRGLKVATRSGPMCQFITVLATPDGWGNQSVTLYTKTLLICNFLIITLNIVCLFDLGSDSESRVVDGKWPQDVAQFDNSSLSLPCGAGEDIKV